jgi:hypothetical protein
MDDRVLQAAVDQAMVAFAARTGNSIALNHDLGHRRLDVNEELRILRVITESLANIGHHSATGLASVDLGYGPCHELRVAIDDDRADFRSYEPDSRHHGPSIMRGRTASLGGPPELVQKPTGGTKVRLAFPPRRLTINTENICCLKRQHLLIDDHPLLRSGVAQLLATGADIEVVGEAGDGESGVDLAAALLTTSAEDHADRAQVADPRETGRGSLQRGHRAPARHRGCNGEGAYQAPAAQA